VREHGVLQFINTFNAHKDREGEKLLWGEELEYHILKARAPHSPHCAACCALRLGSPLGLGLGLGLGSGRGAARRGVGGS